MAVFEFSDDNKRYHTLSYHNRSRGLSAHKAAIDAGFTCPNIDGSRGTGGCIYCSEGSGYFTAPPSLSVTQQLDLELQRIHAKRPEASAVAYFQAHTNTYAPLPRLRALFEEALAHPGVSALAVATRADCLSKETLDYLAELAARCPLTVELGLQTVHDKTAALINRGHSFDEFLLGYAGLRERGIRICVHVIDGLPGEDRPMMLETARVLGRLRPEAVKLHLLHVIRGTALEEMYLRGEYAPMTLEEYVDTVVAQLELLPAETVIERITGDGDRRTLVAPRWSLDKLRVLGSIDKRMAELDTVQGRFFAP